MGLFPQEAGRASVGCVYFLTLSWLVFVWFSLLEGLWKWEVIPRWCKLTLNVFSINASCTSCFLPSFPNVLGQILHLPVPASQWVGYLHIWGQDLARFIIGVRMPNSSSERRAVINDCFSLRVAFSQADGILFEEQEYLVMKTVRHCFLIMTPVSWSLPAL